MHNCTTISTVKYGLNGIKCYYKISFATEFIMSAEFPLGGAHGCWCAMHTPVDAPLQRGWESYRCMYRWGDTSLGMLA